MATKHKMKNIIVIPTYNEKKNIKILIIKILKNFNNIEIIIVDDSPDQEIKKILSEFNTVFYIHREKKLGRGSAVLKGMNYALEKNDFTHLIEMDADLSHNPEEIEKNLNFITENNVDLLISSRYLKESKIINWPLKRKVLSFFANLLAKFFLKVPVKDYTNGFRIYSKNAVRHVVKECGQVGDGFIILSEIFVQLYYNNFKVSYMPTIFVDRVMGKSNVTLKEILNSLLGLSKVFSIKSKLTKEQS